MSDIKSKNKYNHKEIEQKWATFWKNNNIYKTPEINNRSEKKYILDMFPYPSGKAMHVGHAEGYVGTDIVSRYYRMNGKAVLHPMGWDAFGLPAENYAIKTGIHPRLNTNNAIEMFKTQLDSLGLTYDWDREIGTHNPEYYKWTQWWFTFLYKRNLVYKKEASVNWCPACLTVLANEQVVNGYCERCDSLVEQKNMSQWYFKITEYADRLINDLKKVDWPESTKINQINWIGKSEGAEIDFQIENSDLNIRIFTTRLDTIFGASFIVLAPEHKIVLDITTADKKEEIKNYIEQTKHKTELERTSEKIKSGVFTGSYAVNPFNNKRIPIWIGDFVLANYGTGAIMGVPAHDERDYEFASKYNLEITQVISNNIDSNLPYTEKDGFLINSDEYNNLTINDAFEKLIKEAENNNFGERKINYKLRDWSISRQRYWGCPIPIVYDKDNNPILVEESDLPVLLPEDVEFMPTGRSPLNDHPDFMSAPEKYGIGSRREPDTMDTFVDSSWYFFRFCDPNNEINFADPESMKKWAPVDIYVGGAEHTVLHLMYARFFTKVLFDAGLIDFDEPFLSLRHPGMILGEDSRKMSKRWGNVINPLDVIEEIGADSLRTYEMFMGPFDQSKPWNTNTIQGVRRFLDRVYAFRNQIIFDKKDNEVEIELNKLIKKATQDIENFKFNTTVAEFMKFMNLLEDKKVVEKSQWERYLIILAPFAPFLCEELWEIVGNSTSIHKQNWPKFDESLLNDESITIGIQVNGKLRSEITISNNESEDDIKSKVLDLEQIKVWIDGKEIKKFIYIPGKIISIVV